MMEEREEDGIKHKTQGNKQKPQRTKETGCLAPIYKRERRFF